MLADSANGYTWDFNVYIGKASGREVSECGLGYDVVMKLIGPLLDQGYQLFVDNFYTSPILLLQYSSGKHLQLEQSLRTARGLQQKLKGENPGPK